MKKVLLILFLSSLSIAPVMVPTAVAAIDCTSLSKIDCARVSICTWVGTTPGSCIQSADGTSAATDKAPTAFKDVTGLMNLITTIGDYVFMALMAVAGMFLIIAGFMYATAGGSPEKAGKGRQMLINALIGVVIGLLARGIVQVIKSIVPST